MEKTDHELTVMVSEEELVLLRKLDFPCSEEILASARPTDYGHELYGSAVDFEFLVGFVAFEANHGRRRSRHEFLLDNIAEGIEAALFGGA
jgi:hypothetical protein